MSILKSSKVRKSRKTRKSKNTTGSSIDSETDTRTAFVHKNVTSVNKKRTESDTDVVNFPSQRRLSSGSYTLENPTFPLKSEQEENSETPTLPVIKTPIPLPRRKKSKENKLHDGEGEAIEMTTKGETAPHQDESDSVVENRLFR